MFKHTKVEERNETLGTQLQHNQSHLPDPQGSILERIQYITSFHIEILQYVPLKEKDFLLGKITKIQYHT